MLATHTALLSALDVVPPRVLDGTLHAAVILALAPLAAFVLRRRSAAARSLVWSFAIVAALAAPALAPLLPSWHVLPSTAVDEPTAWQPEVVTHCVAALPADNPTPAATATPTPTAVVPPVEETVDAPAETSPHRRTSGLFLIWCGGTAASLAPVLAGALSLALLRCRARRVTSGRCHDLLGRLSAEVGLHRAPILLQTERRGMPMTWGLFRPVVLLPENATTWSKERLSAVILHELAHVCRRDCLAQLVAQLTRAAYWFNPFAWLACRRLRAEQERACDDAVLTHGHPGPDYAEHLLAVSAGLPERSLARPVALAIGPAGRLELRLRAVLDRGADRRPPTRRTAALAAVAAFALLVPLASTTLLPPAVAADAAADDKPADGEAVKKLAEVRSLLLQNAATPPEEKRLTAAAIRGMVGALNDPYSAYMDPEESALHQREFQGKFAGIGAQLQLKDGRLTVVTPIPNSPAHKAGLKPGDVIAAIDGKPTQGEPLPDAVRRIIGQAGTEVRLQLVREGGKETEMKLTRAELRMEAVTGFVRKADGWDWFLDPAQKIGYAHVLTFTTDSARDLAEVVRGMKKDGLKGLILDLRYCPGGMLNEAVKVASLFLKEGTVVELRGAKGNQELKADGADHLGDFPLLVLVGGQTASAAEIVAGALQHHGRAVVLGGRTFGKGSIQALHPVEAGGTLKLTIGHYHLPGGRILDRKPGEKSWGIDPDDGFYVPLSATQLEAQQAKRRQRELVGGPARGEVKRTPEALVQEQADPQLAAALRTMSARLKDGAFAKVGQGNAAQLAVRARQEELEKKREQLLKELKQLDQELSPDGEKK